jgi:hypothetical protein
MAAKSASPKPDNPNFHPENYAYPHCREQHVWQPYDAVIDKKLKKGFRIRVCKVCTMKVHTVIDLDPVSLDYGRVIERHYHYPRDYQIKGGINWHDRGLLVVQNFMNELRREVD